MASKATDPDGLTIKQRAFVQFYVGKANGNGFLAAKMAGYSGNDATLKNAAHKLLKIPKVAAAIRNFVDASNNDAVSSAKERQRLLDDIVWGRVEDVSTFMGAHFPMPASLTTRLAANRDLARMRNEMSEKREIEHKGAMVNVYLPSNGRD